MPQSLRSGRVANDALRIGFRSSNVPVRRSVPLRTLEAKETVWSSVGCPHRPVRSSRGTSRKHPSSTRRLSPAATSDVRVIERARGEPFPGREIRFVEAVTFARSCTPLAIRVTLGGFILYNSQTSVRSPLIRQTTFVVREPCSKPAMYGAACPFLRELLKLSVCAFVDSRYQEGGPNSLKRRKPFLRNAHRDAYFKCDDISKLLVNIYAFHLCVI